MVWWSGHLLAGTDESSSLITTIMDELMECPFNSSHRIIRHRMPIHLVKCKKSYTGPPLESCPYNAMHMVPKEKMVPHLMDCPDYHIAQGVGSD
ncbi:gametocyte-specific factor 1-like [Bradysia coprophila]|uniref:gametocyte-specific factor 1-like n=1 Tax=Bradysia coprophila TaxID=38358 RepID=UPI00187DC9A6|nr:gametocyte-specific factor 1-like [Bradysia coprophila]